MSGVGGFRTTGEQIAALPFALSDILHGKQILTDGKKATISKVGLNEEVLEELRVRFEHWRFTVEEDETKLDATPIVD